MSSTPTQVNAPLTVADLKSSGGWRFFKSNLMIVLLGLAFVVVVVPVAFVLYSVIEKGIGIVVRDFPSWFTTDVPVRSRQPGPGMKSAIIGTVLITAAASVIAIPIGVLGAIYLNEYGRTSSFARVVRFLSTVMTGVPSIVMGLFIYIIVTVSTGQVGIAGSLALAALMLPIVIRSTEEMLRLVPDHLREASLALGSTKSRTILTVVLPSAAPGVVSGCLLAVARAAGETAPLLFTIGAATATNWNLFHGEMTTLSRQIFANALATTSGPVDRAWGAALTLMTLTFLFTVIARVVTAFSQKRR